MKRLLVLDERRKRCRGMFFDNEDYESQEVEETNNQSSPPTLGPSTPTTNSGEGSSSEEL